MTVTVERQVVYLGAGLTQTAWIVWDAGVMVGWDTDQDAARQRAHDVNEQKEHRDGE
jgi:hypothetical protein